MRFHILLLLNLLSLSTMSGQRSLSNGGKALTPLNDAWQISLTVSPNRTYDTKIPIYVTALDTLPLSEFEVIRRGRLGRTPDTLLRDSRITGDYYLERQYGDNGFLPLSDPELQLRFSLKVHHRIKDRLEFAGGLT